MLWNGDCLVDSIARTIADRLGIVHARSMMPLAMPRRPRAPHRLPSIKRSERLLEVTITGVSWKVSDLLDTSSLKVRGNAERPRPSAEITPRAIPGIGPPQNGEVRLLEADKPSEAGLRGNSRKPAGRCLTCSALRIGSRGGKAKTIVSY